MTNYNERLDEIVSKLARDTSLADRVASIATTASSANNASERYEWSMVEAKQALTSLTKELVAEAIGEDESLVEVHKRNLVVASKFNAVIKSRNSLRHKQRQDLKNLLKELEEV